MSFNFGFYCIWIEISDRVGSRVKPDSNLLELSELFRVEKLNVVLAIRYLRA